LAACVLVGIGVVAFWPGEREPEYKGKKLSEWVRPYTWRYDDVEDTNHLISKEREAADDAIQHMGTNALHWLVRWIAYERPAWKTKVREIVRKIPAQPVHYWCVRDDQLRSAARDTFVALGTNAVAAVPELAQVVKTSRDADARDAAVSALGYMGKDGYPCLLEPLDDPKTSYAAARSILQMSQTGVDVSSAIPGLLLMDRETFKFRTAYPEHYYFAPPMHQNPQNIIPALTNCLRHANSDVRAEAAHALGLIGERALPTLPALREALDDRVIAVQEAAVEALEKIAPEVLTNGVKDF
jgi:HEAT repeats